MNESPPAARGRPRRRRALTITAITAALLTAAGTALAAVATIPATSTVGAGGYEATTANPAGFTDSQAVTAANQYGLIVKSPGAQGVFLCDTSTGLAAQAGQVSSNVNTAYSVVSVLGKPTGGCPNNGVAPGPVTFPGLAVVPNGHHVWTNVLVAQKVKRVRLLICVLVDKDNGHPVATPSPTATQLPGNGITAPSASPSESVSTAPPTDISGSGGTEAPTESPTVSQPTASAEAPSESPSVSQPIVVPTVNPQGQTVLSIPGFTLKCRVVTKTIRKATVTFEAQDIDAPTVNPLAGDLAGVQTRTVPLPAGTVFDSAGAGIVQNTAALTPCTGTGFPALLSGPAAYTSRACQNVNITEYATAAIGGGASQDYGALNTSEVVTPNSSAALIAPNHLYTGNAPPSPPPIRGRGLAPRPGQR